MSARRAASILWLALLSCGQPGAEMPVDPVGGQPDASEIAAQPESLPGALAAGRRLFEQGRGTPAVEAEIEGMAVGAAQFPCIGCHGEQGQGRSEGGLVAPAIDWHSLGAPRQGFKPRPAYSRDALQRALTTGLDPAGRTLDAGMPRYRLSAAQVDALAVYLGSLSERATPGVDDTLVRLALITGGDERFAALADAVRDAALAAAEQENARGGAYGRRIELVPIRFRPDMGSDALAARLSLQPLLAAVGTFTPGRAAETRAALDAAALPSLFPIEPQTTDAADQVPLYAAATRQATALAERWRGEGAPEAVVLSDGSPLAEAAARAVQRVAVPAGAVPARIPFSRTEADAAVRSLGELRPASMFAFIDARSLRLVLDEAVPPPSGLRVYGLLDQVGPVADRLRAGISLVLANPRAASGEDLPPREGHGEIAYTARLAIHSAAESLRWSGRRLTRARLLEAARTAAAAVYRLEMVEFVAGTASDSAGAP